MGHIDYERYLSLLRISSVHVYLTYPFVLSWSLIESMSVGCSIIASDTAPVREVIHDNETGYLTNFFDSDALSSKIEFLLKNNSERQRLGSNARRYAINNYDLKSVCLPAQLEWINSL